MKAESQLEIAEIEMRKKVAEKDSLRKIGEIENSMYLDK